MPDEEESAIKALLTGDISGLEILMKRHQIQALRVAYNICRDQQTAEDAVADAFLSIHRHIHTYDASRPFQPWFFRIVINSVRSAISRNKKFSFSGDAESFLHSRVDPTPEPETTVLQNELAITLLRRIDALPMKQRIAVILRYYLDMDEAAMSTTLGVPVGTVKWRLFQARKRLHRVLIEDTDEPLYVYQKGHGS